MEKTHGDIDALLTDVITETMLVLVRLSAGEFGDVSEGVCTGVAEALGLMMLGIQVRAQEGGYRVE